MYLNKSILVVILARGGSKGIKNKNLKKILDKPLIQYSFDQLKKSKLIDDAILSSDSNNIIKFAKKNGILAPFVRPKNLSGDNAKSEDAVLHAINYLKNNDKIYDYVLLIEPTSPLRTYKDIDGIIKFIITNKFDTAVSISNVSNCHPNFMYTLNRQKIKKSFSSLKFISKRRQNLDKIYFMEGSLYISKVNSFLKNKNFVSKNSGGYILPKWKSFEIDEPADIKIIKSLLLNIKEFDHEK
jgi:CMP-N,N'-diacetyllegionaminic acid synthase